MTDFSSNGGMTSNLGRGLPMEIFSFAVIGIIALSVDLAALWMALNVFGLGLYSGRLFSYVMAATFTWWLNRTFTFKDANRWNPARQWAKFVAANAIGGIVNYAAYAAIVSWVPGLVPAVHGTLLVFLPYGATAVGSLLGLAFNFTASRLLVFQRR